jgi:hypothetical protein
MYKNNQHSPNSYPLTYFPDQEARHRALGKSALVVPPDHMWLRNHPDISYAKGTPPPTSQPDKRRNGGNPHYDPPKEGGGGLVGARPKAIGERGLYTYLTTESLWGPR